ncbi:hypothetical protein OVX87_33275 [Klebsiella pneumoniae]|nr:hypothetical protein [Klebsiella pneumoniae]
MQVIPAGAWLTSGKRPCLRWLDATDARSFPSFWLSGWTPATPEIHPAPSGSRLTTHKIHGAGRT